MKEVKTCCRAHFIQKRPFIFSERLIVCQKCGSRRCPKAAWCVYKCTGSNKRGQVGEEEEGEET